MLLWGHRLPGLTPYPFSAVVHTGLPGLTPYPSSAVVSTSLPEPTPYPSSAVVPTGLPGLTPYPSSAVVPTGLPPLVLRPYPSILVVALGRPRPFFRLHLHTQRFCAACTLSLHCGHDLKHCRLIVYTSHSTLLACINNYLHFSGLRTLGSRTGH